MLIMLCLTLIVLNIMYILTGQKEVSADEDQEPGCVTVAGLLHASALSGTCNLPLSNPGAISPIRLLFQMNLFANCSHCRTQDVTIE